MAGHNANSNPPGKRKKAQTTDPPPSRSAVALRLAQMKFHEKNEDLLRDKARERMERCVGKNPPYLSPNSSTDRHYDLYRRRLRAQEDPQLATEAAAQKRVHDTTYREKHRDMIRFKQTLRRNEEHYRKHRAHPKDRKIPDYSGDLITLEDDRWLKKMSEHRRKGMSGGM
ncbi:hypothetical protein B0H16DRAFT_1745051 [Mycena metata]|uniref:Uncharacterized protein n=1 Tax=Mycena metata TaxID=1033252 RepID=A0AAD7H4X5_9AGAR|nr:hypothetical protein B0H16DRAFT_1745051 [Mycena metata]